MTFWDLSPDGRQIAFGARDPHHGIIQILSPAGATIHEVGAPEHSHLETVAWAADGKSLFLTEWTSKGSLLVHLALDGRNNVLYKSSAYFGSPSPSTDGRYLAFGQVTAEFQCLAY